MSFRKLSLIRALVLVGLGFLLFANTVHADGMILSRHTWDIWEPGQIALILHDEETDTQDMILQVQFYGDAEDFAWIVPVPSLPALSEADDAVFEDLSRLSRPINRRRNRSTGCSQHDVVALPTDAGNVDVIAEETVGIYETLTLAADDASVLADSLLAWEYLHEHNQEEVEAALQHYIDKSWYFLVMKVSDGADWEPDSHGYWYGFIDPIRMSFESEDVVFPMRISAASATVDTDVLLYVCARHRMTFPGAKTDYAKRMGPTEINSLPELYPDLAQYLIEECFLTKLTRRYQPTEMTEDLVLTRAPDDSEFRRIRHTSIPVAESGFLVFWGWMASRAWTTRRGKRKD